MDKDIIIRGVTCGVLFGCLLAITITALRIWQHRPRKPQPTLTIAIRADVGPALEALDRMIAALKQDEAYQREAALGNDVVRLRHEIRPVREAREIIEREMAR